MNTRTKLLCFFAVFLFVGSMAFSGVNAYVSIYSANTEQMLPADTYGDDRRNEAVSILIYTETVDLNEEYANVLSSLKGSLEGKFTYANLTEYSQLGSMIDEFDVLLIPEIGELGNHTFADTIQSAWAGILPSFVAEGGIVICMTYGFTVNIASSARIINGTLMDIHNPEAASFNQIDIFDSNDALARNMPASYIAADGSRSFDIPDAIKVMEDNTNAKTVVAHKIIGKGHVVLLGFDMYDVDANQDILLRNAVLLHRHIVFDNSHGQSYDIHVGFDEIAMDLPYYGFSVSSIDVFDPEVFESCEIFVITSASVTYNATEIQVIHDFVDGGGALFIASEWGEYGDETDDLINDFGFIRNTTAIIQDSDENAGDPGWARFAQPVNFEMHSANLDVDVMELYYATGFIGMPSSAVPLIVTDADGTATWGGVENATSIPMAAANLVGDGRIIVLGDTAPFRSADIDSDGTSAYTDSDNEIFLRNAFRWLSGAGIPEQTVVFDQSHNPTYYITSGWAPLAYFLMFNGYNVEYMTFFEPAAFMDADILVICDGSVDYNTTEIGIIVNYVGGGGGLILWGDNTIFGEQVEPIGQEFGLYLNTTGYLDDTDDFDTYASYVIYNSSNFANHPIMDGVHRIEIDRGAGIISVGSGTALISTDNDATAIYIDGSPAPNVPVAAAALYNMGRVVLLTDVNMGELSDPEGDGFGDLYDSDNPVFVANVFKWLGENRAPRVEVITPNGGEVLNGTITIEWAAVDFDSDPLMYNVFISDNNGSDWSLLVDDLLVPEFTWNTTLHDDGNSYMIRVEVSDGMVSAHDESDDPFELDNFDEGGPGLPLDPTLLLIIGAAVIVVVIILIIIMKKKK
ncbi:hypothetical protein EU528_13575 [Candidatus Thorarchaeota archaeon]|nr:MAG: hypothetical protein EU528_13575 [Candidatus Thorarchaeota archaeon]